MNVCSGCGTTVPTDAKFCLGCGRPIYVAAVPAPNKGMEKVKAIFVAVILIAGAWAFWSFEQAEEVLHPPETAANAATHDPCADNAFAWLLALKEGNSIAPAFWKVGSSPVQLFAVREFTRIKGGNYLQSSGAQYKPPRHYEEFEVQSSTQGGIEIRKRWDVVMEPSSKNLGSAPCAIVALKEAQ